MSTVYILVFITLGVSNPVQDLASQHVSAGGTTVAKGCTPHRVVRQPDFVRTTTDLILTNLRDSQVGQFVNGSCSPFRGGCASRKTLGGSTFHFCTSCWCNRCTLGQGLILVLLISLVNAEPYLRHLQGRVIRAVEKRILESRFVRSLFLDSAALVVRGRDPLDSDARVVGTVWNPRGDSQGLRQIHIVS